MSAGRHFLQIPGPSNVPDRVLRAMDLPVMDHRGPAFADVGQAALGGMKWIFGTESHVVIYPSSATGAWEAALVNTLSPGDTVLMYETGHFAAVWKNVADRLGLNSIFIESDWRAGADPSRIEECLRNDPQHEIKAVCVVHSETSNGSVSPIHEIRKTIDRAGHPALFMVDTVSGLATAPYAHDAWGVDVSVSGSQKGLMLPPGLSFNAISAKAMAASETAGLRKSYWAWDQMLGPNKAGYFPYTPATNLLFGLNEALAMLKEEGMANVFKRHARYGSATRAAVKAWGLETLCQNPDHYSDALTAVVMPDGHSADSFRSTTLETYNMSLGNGLSKVADRVFRIGHLGDFNDLMLCGTLAGVEMGLADAGIPHKSGGVTAAMNVLRSQ